MQRLSGGVAKGSLEVDGVDNVPFPCQVILMNPTEKRLGPQHLLFDADLLQTIDPRIFQPEWLRQAGLMRGSAEGRGTTHFMELDGRACVLRHYLRGGLVAGLLGDRYLRRPRRWSRPWREWRLLAHLAELRLPAPLPVAARLNTAGMFYRADLITLRIEDSRSLATILRTTPLERRLWRAMGETIGRFHHHGVFHADLNAHNILLDGSGAVYLIDFDRGSIRAPATGWQRTNIERLRRSLEKLSAQPPGLHFTSADWRTLLDGWRG